MRSTDSRATDSVNNGGREAGERQGTSYNPTREQSRQAPGSPRGAQAFHPSQERTPDMHGDNFLATCKRHGLLCCFKEEQTRYFPEATEVSTLPPSQGPGELEKHPRIGDTPGETSIYPRGLQQVISERRGNDPSRADTPPPRPPKDPRRSGRPRQLQPDPQEFQQVVSERRGSDPSRADAPPQRPPWISRRPKPPGRAEEGPSGS
jgi:hypothetical protein